jgi:hypothetical protein
MKTPDPIRSRGLCGPPLRLALPAVLIALGVAALSGCLFIPTGEKVVTGRDVSTDVGDAKSKKSVRIGTATRQDVARVLGEPEYATPSFDRVLYTWRIRNGVWFYPLCFSSSPNYRARLIELRFDAAGVLRGFELKGVEGSWIANRPHAGHLVPRDMRPVSAMTRPTPMSP